MIFLVAALFTAQTLLQIWFFRSLSRVNPVVWFMIFHWLIGFGSIILSDINAYADLQYALLFLASSFSFFVGASICELHRSSSSDYKNFFKMSLQADSPVSLGIIWLVLFLSLIVTVIYYIAVGGNIVLNIALGFAVEDFSTTRLAAYSGDTYFAPGYVNQFKNVLLPVCASIIGFNFWIRRQSRSFVVFALCSTLILPVALLGTGQRAFLAYSVTAFLFGVLLLTRLRIRVFLAPAVLIIGLFAYMTYLYKSYQMLPSDDPVTFALTKTLERFLYTEQEGTLVTYRLLADRDSVLFYEWFEQIRGVLPGVSGSYLQHELFAARHGTDRGTEAVSTLASVIYNGTLGSVPIIYLFLGFCYQALYKKMLKGRRRPSRIFCYAAAFFYLSIFVTGGPGTLINNGLVAIFLLSVLIRFRLRNLHGAMEKSF